MDDKLVEWLFKNPLSDGGTFCGVQDVMMKYGAVPAEVMPESYNANNTSRMSSIIALKLREYGLALRQGAAKGQKPAVLEKRKVEMLGTIYRILSTCLGEPPTTFKWTMKDAKGRPISTKEYTPKSFYEEYVGEDLKNNYVMLMNDPSRPYHRTYTIDMDRHSYDGAQWTYLNLPIEEIKPLAIASIKDSTMMYFSCDVGKFYDSKTGVLCTENFDYATLFDTDFPMDKADRIRTFASASSHAMTLMAVDLDAEGKPTKWMVENSWGPNSGVKGHLIMTDKWFDEYMFRVVVEKRFVPEKLLKLYNHEPTRLPAWDPLFSEDK
jgi:bleomycin hydrolase